LFKITKKYAIEHKTPPAESDCRRGLKERKYSVEQFF